MDYRQHRPDYCQFLISSQISYTQTYLADHSERYSHDSELGPTGRALPVLYEPLFTAGTLTPRTLWDNVRHDVVASEQGYKVEFIIAGKTPLPTQLAAQLPDNRKHRQEHPGHDKPDHATQEHDKQGL